MYGETETSRAPRVAWAILHAGLVGVAAWLLLGGGFAQIAGAFGSTAHAGNLARRSLLLAFGVVMWARMLFTAFVLLRRRFGWGEFWGVLGACAIYQVGFAALGAGSPAPLGLWDALGAVLFTAGSAINTGAEVQRRRFKVDPANRGRLFTGGLFRLSRHVNYFGDLLWVCGWAMVTHDPWAIPIPVLVAAMFRFGMIPQLSSYLRRRYDAQYDAWARDTKAFIPYVW